MRTIKYTSAFKKDYKREKKGQHRNTVDAELQTVLELLQADEALPEKYRDHALVSNWVGHRDCHIKPDLVLIYKKTEEGELLILKLVRLGSHSELAEAVQIKDSYFAEFNKMKKIATRLIAAGLDVSRL